MQDMVLLGMYIEAGESADRLPLGPIQRPPCPPKNRQGRQGFQQILSDGFLMGLSCIGVFCGNQRMDFIAFDDFQKKSWAWDEMKNLCKQLWDI